MPHDAPAEPVSVKATAPRCDPFAMMVTGSSGGGQPREGPGSDGFRRRARRNRAVVDNRLLTSSPHRLPASNRHDVLMTWNLTVQTNKHHARATLHRNDRRGPLRPRRVRHLPTDRQLRDLSPTARSKTCAQISTEPRFAAHETAEITMLEIGDAERSETRIPRQKGKHRRLVKATHRRACTTSRASETGQPTSARAIPPLFPWPVKDI